MEHESEVVSMWVTLYDEEELQRISREAAAREAAEEGMAQGMAQGIVSSISSLTETLGLTAQQAMDALRIPDGDRERYLAQLESAE